MLKYHMDMDLLCGHRTSSGYPLNQQGDPPVLSQKVLGPRDLQLLLLHSLVCC